MPYAGKVDKTMAAETVGHLKHLLETELRRCREENELDIAMFLGVDGRIFASSIPNELNPREYRLLNLLKGNLAHICNQLSGQNMMMSVEQFEAGTIIIGGVGPALVVRVGVGLLVRPRTDVGRVLLAYERLYLLFLP